MRLIGGRVSPIATLIFPVRLVIVSVVPAGASIPIVGAVVSSIVASAAVRSAIADLFLPLAPSLFLFLRLLFLVSLLVLLNLFLNVHHESDAHETKDDARNPFEVILLELLTFRSVVRIRFRGTRIRRSKSSAHVEFAVDKECRFGLRQYSDIDALDDKAVVRVELWSPNMVNS